MMTNEFIYLIIGGAGFAIFGASISQLGPPGPQSRKDGPPWPPVSAPPVAKRNLSADDENGEATPNGQEELTAEQNAAEEKAARSHDVAVARQAKLRKLRLRFRLG
jgi:hypothetical protein